MRELPQNSPEYYRQALEVVTDLAKQYPAAADAYYQKAKVQEALGNTNQAIINLKRATKYDSTNQLYRQQLARLFLEDGNFKRAEENIVKAQQLGDRSADTYAMLSSILYGQQQYSQSQNYINRALESEPNRLEWLLLKANLYKAEGDTSQAIRFLEEKAEVKNPSPDLYNILAVTYADQGNYAKALYYSSKRNETEPAGATELLTQARWLAAAGQADSAVILLKRINVPDDMRISKNLALGEVLVSTNQLDSAQKYLNQAIMLDSRAKEAYFWLGKLYDKKRQYFTARDQFTNALLIDSAYTKARQELSGVEQKIYWIQKRRQQEETERIAVPQPLNPTLGN